MVIDLRLVGRQLSVINYLVVLRLLAYGTVEFELREGSPGFVLVA